jgi:hypothetical protein
MMKMFLLGVKKDCDVIYFVKYEDEGGYISLTHEAYDGRSIISDNDGEERAKETLSDEDYWKDAGMLPSGKERNFLIDFIDFEKVAKQVINNDGWQNVNGEYKFIGCHKDVDYYVTFDSCGAINRKDLETGFRWYAQSQAFIMALFKESDLHIKQIDQLSPEELVIHNQFLQALKSVPENNLEDCAFLIPYLNSEEGFDENKFYNTIRSNKRK